MTQADDRTKTGKAEDNGQSGSGGWTPEDFLDYEFAKFLGKRMAQEKIDEFLGKEEVTDDGWTRVDLGPYVRGEVVVPEPSVGVVRSDGVALAYEGRDQAVVANTGAGKTWLSCASALAEMRKGNRVLYVHYEEPNPALTMEWLKLLGATDDEILDLLDFVGPKAALRKGRLEKLLDPAPSLVIHDGVNQAMALLDGEHFAVGGAADFRTRLVVPCLEAGATTWACDHFPMGQSGKRVEAYGSVHKGNILTGARFSLENAEPFGRGMRGRSNLYLTKDRPGRLKQHGRLDPKIADKFFFGSLIIDSNPRIGDPDHFRFELKAPTEESTAEAERQSARQRGGRPDLAPLKTSIHAVVCAQPDHRVSSQRELFALLRKKSVSFTDDQARDAIVDMLVEDHRRLVEVPGKGSARGYEARESAS